MTRALCRYGLHRFQSRIPCDRAKVAAPVPDGYPVIDCDCGDQAIHRGPDRDAPPFALPIDFRGGNEQPERDWIAKDWNREECRAKGVTPQPRLESLEDLLNNRGAGREAKEVLLSDGAAWLRRQKFNPYGRVNQDHVRRRLLGCWSSRILDKSPSQIPDPRNCGILWMFRIRITSSSAVFTAAEYVFAANTLVAWRSRCSSNTRFVRFMCIGYHAIPSDADGKLPARICHAISRLSPSPETRADRLLSALLLLQAHGWLSRRELAKQLEVPEQAVSRDMELLSAAGAPVSGADDGWQLDETWRARMPGSDEAQLYALLLAQPRIAGDVWLAAAAESALEKVMEALPVSLRERAASLRKRLYIDTTGWRGATENLSMLPIVQEAVSRDRKLAIRYLRAGRELVERIVDPLGLVAKDSTWYLFARTPNGLRTYRVSRIEEASVLDEQSERPEDFDLAAWWKSNTEQFQEEMSREVEARRRFIAERQEAARRAAQELEIAKQVQARLFPQILPRLATLEYAGICVQARQVGGDYYDFLDLGGGRLGLVIGDISGKGIAAALLMANLQANLRSQCAIALDQPQRLLRSVNQLFFENTTDSAYATLFFGEYDDHTQRLRYANCGHLSALLLRGDDTLERLDSTCTVLGLFKEWDCSIGERRLLPGDTLALYTDGITESFNDADEEFGEQRLIEALWRNRELSSQELLPAVVDDVRRFSPREQHDDITLIVAKCCK